MYPYIYLLYINTDSLILKITSLYHFSQLFVQQRPRQKHSSHQQNLIVQKNQYSIQFILDNCIHHLYYCCRIIESSLYEKQIIQSGFSLN